MLNSATKQTFYTHIPPLRQSIEYQ